MVSIMSKLVSGRKSLACHWMTSIHDNAERVTINTLDECRIVCKKNILTIRKAEVVNDANDIYRCCIPVSFDDLEHTIGHHPLSRILRPRRRLVLPQLLSRT